MVTSQGRGSCLKSLLIRCDASSNIGYGHEMRCLSLAFALKAYGVEVIFTCRFFSENLIRSGFRVITLLCDCDEEELCDVEMSQVKDLSSQVEMLIVDHYGWQEKHFKEISYYFEKLGVIHDFPNRKYETPNWELIPEKMNQYVLLRQEFIDCRKKCSRIFDHQDNHILITMGGGDTSSYILDVLQVLENYEERVLNIVCLLTSASVDLRYYSKISKHHVKIEEGSRRVASLMRGSDIAISAGGSSCWELACLGVPMLLRTLSANQEGIVSKLVNENCARQFVLDNSLNEEIQFLLSSIETRRRMSEMGQRCVDGLGASRVATSLIALCDKA